MADSDFYHVIDLPGIGPTQGQWDLRARVDDYMGRFDFRGKSVLEIGPASGFLTMEMEKRGADVVAVEITDDPGWDFVPFPDVPTPTLDGQRKHMTRIKNSWWFVHQTCGLSARLFYGDAYNLPDALGQFDVAMLGCVLTHCRSPVSILEQCARRAKAIIITEAYVSELEDGRPICLLHPSVENKDWSAWWYFSTTFLVQFLRVMGFTVGAPLLHVQSYHGVPVPLFTVVGQRG